MWPPPNTAPGLRRLFALQIKDALKYLEKNIPDLQKMAVAYMQVGKNGRHGQAAARRELRAQIIMWRWTALFCSTRCPPDEPSLQARACKRAGAA
jgi:ATP-dependent helicase HrpA